MDISLIKLTPVMLMFMIRHCLSLRGFKFHLAWRNEQVTSHQVGDKVFRRSSSECAAYCASKIWCVEGFTYSKITTKCVCFEVAANYIRAPETGTNVYRLYLGGKTHSFILFLTLIRLDYIDFQNADNTASGLLAFIAAV